MPRDFCIFAPLLRVDFFTQNSRLLRERFFRNRKKQRANAFLVGAKVDDFCVLRLSVEPDGCRFQPWEDSPSAEDSAARTESLQLRARLLRLYLHAKIRQQKNLAIRRVRPHCQTRDDLVEGRFRRLEPLDTVAEVTRPECIKDQMINVEAQEVP